MLIVLPCEGLALGLSDIMPLRLLSLLHTSATLVQTVPSGPPRRWSGVWSTINPIAQSPARAWRSSAPNIKRPSTVTGGPAPSVICSGPFRAYGSCAVAHRAAPCAWPAPRGNADRISSWTGSRPRIPPVSTCRRFGIMRIEIYRTLSETPIQFLRTDNQCGTIVIWTRSGSR